MKFNRMRIAAPSYFEVDQRGQVTRVDPLQPVQVPGLHLWNLELWRMGMAPRDRV